MNQFFKDTRPGGQLLALALIFVLLFILTVGSVLVFTMLTGIAVDELLSQAVSQIIVFGGTALVFAWLFWERPLDELRLGKAPRLGVKMLLAVGILLLLLPMSDWLTRINDAMHLPQGLSEVEDKMRELGDRSQALVECFLLRDGVCALITNILVLALIPAVCEELLFRGALQGILCRCFVGRHHLSILVTAAVFSLFHFEIFAFLPRFMLGIALGYLFHYGGSLWVNATAHFTNNAIVVVLYYLANKGVVDIEVAESINAPWYLAVVGLALATAVFLWGFCKDKKKKNNKNSCI